MSFSPQLQLSSKLQRVINLYWTHYTKSRTVFFIERSHNNKDFEKIGVLNTCPNTNYTFSDLFPLKGKNYYRLISVDEKGNQNISGVEHI